MISNSFAQVIIVMPSTIIFYFLLKQASVCICQQKDCYVRSEVTNNETFFADDTYRIFSDGFVRVIVKDKDYV